MAGRARGMVCHGALHGFIEQSGDIARVDELSPAEELLGFQYRLDIRSVRVFSLHCRGSDRSVLCIAFTWPLSLSKCSF